MKQTNASPKHSSLVYYLGTLAMLASMLLLPHLIPSWADGITPAGVSIACVFVGAIIGILTTNDLILCALFAMGGLVINGIQTPAQVISSFMGASYVWQIVVLYALCYVIIRDNTGEVIARFLLTRRFTQKYPMVMVMMLLFAFGLAAAFMGVFGALIVGFTLLDGIYAEAGIEPKSKLARLLCLGAFITMCIGPMTIGSMAALNLAAGQFFLAAAGVQVVTFRFVAEAFAILIAFCAVFALALRFLFRCDIRALGRVDLAQAHPGQHRRGHRPVPPDPQIHSKIPDGHGDDAPLRLWPGRRLHGGVRRPHRGFHPAGWNLRRGRYRAQKQAGPPAMPGRLYHHVYRPYDHRQHGGP